MFMLVLHLQQAKVNNSSKQREDVGVELYGVQQELARHQNLREGKENEYKEKHERRVHMEQQLQEVRQMYIDSQRTVNEEKKKGNLCQCHY